MTWDGVGYPGRGVGGDRVIGSSGDLVIGKPESTAEGGCGHTRMQNAKGLATLSREIVWTAPSEPVEILSPGRTHSGL